jgi:hypothetical protein
MGSFQEMTPNGAVDTIKGATTRSNACPWMNTLLAAAHCGSNEPQVDSSSKGINFQFSVCCINWDES